MNINKRKIYINWKIMEKYNNKNIYCYCKLLLQL